LLLFKPFLVNIISDKALPIFGSLGGLLFLISISYVSCVFNFYNLCGYLFSILSIYTKSDIGHTCSLSKLTTVKLTSLFGGMISLWNTMRIT